MRGGDPPQAPPVVPIGREPHGPVKQKHACRLLDRTVGEGGAVEDLLGRVGIGGDDETREADGKGHERLGFEGVGEGGESSVCEGVCEGEG